MPQRFAFLIVAFLLTHQATAAIIANFDASRHDRFLSGTTPNPGFLIDEALIRGIGFNSRYALITPRHVITAAHAGSGPIEFRGSDGVVRTYSSSIQSDLQTPLSTGGTAVSDIRIRTLDAAIPVAHGIQPLAVADGNPLDLIGREFYVIGQNNQAGRNLVDGVGLASFTGGSAPTVVIGYSFDTAANGGVGGLGNDEAGLIGGDSGHHALINSNGTLAVIGAHFGISVPQGSSAANKDRYDSFSTLLSPYLGQIDTITQSSGFSVTRLNITAVPEPSSIVLLVATGLGWAAKRRRFNQAKTLNS
jgi:hypothetical protein